MHLPAIDSRRLGIVSNCWQKQLAGGESLGSLASRALDEGFYHVELRQSCLGTCERGEPPIPDRQALAQLQRQSPRVAFGIAVAYGYLGPQASASDLLFTAGLEAALAVAGPSQPQLRLVDLVHALDPSDTDSLREAAERLARLVDETARRGGLLLIENARQSWRGLREVMKQTRALAGDALRLCYDPANLTMAPDRPALDQAVREISLGELGMVHFKQVHADRLLPALAPGDVDWRDQIAALSDLHFSGPALFEIPASDDIWRQLRHSRDYLSTLEPHG